MKKPKVKSECPEGTGTQTLLPDLGRGEGLSLKVPEGATVKWCHLAACGGRAGRKALHRAELRLRLDGRVSDTLGARRMAEASSEGGSGEAGGWASSWWGLGWAKGTGSLEEQFPAGAGRQSTPGPAVLFLWSRPGDQDLVGEGGQGPCHAR